MRMVELNKYITIAILCWMPLQACEFCRNYLVERSVEIKEVLSDMGPVREYKNLNDLYYEKGKLDGIEEALSIYDLNHSR